MITFVEVKYTGSTSDRTYTYYTDELDLNVGDLVQVPLGERSKTAEVVKVYEPKKVLSKD